MAIDPENIDTVTIPELDTVALALTNLFAHSAPNGKMGKASINALAVFIAPYVASVGASGYVEVTGNTLPAPEIDSAFSIVGKGTYSGIVANGDLNLLSWDGSTWSLTKEINLDLSGFVTKDSVAIDHSILGYFGEAFNGASFSNDNKTINVANGQKGDTSYIFSGIINQPLFTEKWIKPNSKLKMEWLVRCDKYNFNAFEAELLNAPGGVTEKTITLISIDGSERRLAKISSIFHTLNTPTNLELKPFLRLTNQTPVDGNAVIEILEFTTRIISDGVDEAGIATGISSEELTLSASKLGLNFNNPNYKIEFTDQYSDGFTAFNAQGFNEDSALYKILKKNNFQNVCVLGSFKDWEPIGTSEALLTLQNVSIIGIGKAKYNNGLQSMGKGTVLKGPLMISQTSSNVHLQGFSINAGNTVCSAYYGGVDQEGLFYSYLPTPGKGAKGSNIIIRDISILLDKPTSARHALLVEEVESVSIDNVITCNGTHGLTIKADTVKIGSVEAYAHAGEPIIIKSGEVTTYAVNVSILNAVVGQMPIGITNSYVNIAKPSKAVMLDVQAVMANIYIGKVAASYCTQGIFLSLNGGNSIDNFAIDTLMTYDVDVPFVRTGNGKINNFVVGNMLLSNTSSAIMSIDGGTLEDRGMIFNNIVSRHNSARTPLGLVLNNISNIYVGLLDVNNCNAVFNVKDSARLKIGRYIQREEVDATYAVGSLRISANNFLSDSKIIPAPNSLGTIGEVRIIDSFKYECVDPNVWTRVAIMTNW